jgi:tRNA (guanine37-N1)-methyltransferase
MRIDILTLFPKMFDGLFNYSIVGRAIEHNIVDIKLHDIRECTHDKHHVVDDYPYGGGAGMVLKPEPVSEAVEAVMQESGILSVPVILLSPQGRLFNQGVAWELAQSRQIILICGHYEGVDERVTVHVANDEISVGDYVLSGGETAAMVVVDCVVRLLPGALGSEVSVTQDSHTDGLLEYPQYTRPAEYRGWTVPSVLLSGNHGQIAAWRRQQSLLRTLKKRPDLLEKAILTEKDKKFLRDIEVNKTEY